MGYKRTHPDDVEENLVVYSHELLILLYDIFSPLARVVIVIVILRRLVVLVIFAPFHDLLKNQLIYLRQNLLTNERFTEVTCRIL
jgi:hypothetical protein